MGSISTTPPQISPLQLHPAKEMAFSIPRENLATLLIFERLDDGGEWVREVHRYTSKRKQGRTYVIFRNRKNATLRSLDDLKESLVSAGKDSSYLDNMKFLSGSAHDIVSNKVGANKRARREAHRWVAEVRAGTKPVSAEELAAKKKAEQEAANKKRAEEIAAAKKADAEAARLKAEEVAAAKKKADEEEAVKQKAREEAAAKKKAENAAAAKKKQEEEAAAAKKKAEEDAVTAKKAEEAALKLAEEQAAASSVKKAEEEAAAAKKAEQDALARKQAEDAIAKEASEKMKADLDAALKTPEQAAPAPVEAAPASLSAAPPAPPVAAACAEKEVFGDVLDLMDESGMAMDSSDEDEAPAVE